MEIKPIAFIKTDFKEKFGIPRQSGRVDSLCGEIVLEKLYSLDKVAYIRFASVYKKFESLEQFINEIKYCEKEGN